MNTTHGQLCQMSKSSCLLSKWNISVSGNGALKRMNLSEEVSSLCSRLSFHQGNISNIVPPCLYRRGSGNSRECKVVLLGAVKHANGRPGVMTEVTSSFNKMIKFNFPDSIDQRIEHSAPTAQITISILAFWSTFMDWQTNNEKMLLVFFLRDFSNRGQSPVLQSPPIPQR